MNKNKFKIGDRVKNINTYWNSSVCIECNNSAEIGIEGYYIVTAWGDEAEDEEVIGYNK